MPYLVSSGGGGGGDGRPQGVLSGMLVARKVEILPEIAYDDVARLKHCSKVAYTLDGCNPPTCTNASR